MGQEASAYTDVRPRVGGDGADVIKRHSNVIWIVDTAAKTEWRVNEYQNSTFGQKAARQTYEMFRVRGMEKLVPTTET